MKYWKEATSTISAMSQPKAKSLRLVKSTGSPRQQTPSSTLRPTGSPRQQTPSSTLRPTGSPRQQTPSSTLRPTGSPRQTSLSPHTCGQTNTLAKVLHSSSPSYPHKQPLKPTNHSLELSFNPSPQRKSVSNPPQTPTLSKSFTCTFCQKSYKHRAALYKHEKKAHPKEQKNKTGNITCLETQCTFKCRYLDELRSHLQSNHGMRMEREKKTFTTVEGMEIFFTCSMPLCVLYCRFWTLERGI